MYAKNGLKYALATFLALKIFTSLVVIAAALVVTPNFPPAPFSPAVVADLENRGPLFHFLVSPWYRWDTTHYIEIADLGYTSSLQNTVWPPMYPALIRLFGLAFQPSMLAALVVSNLAAIAAFYLLYQLVAEYRDEPTARRVLIWTAIFPSGFYFVAAYTEALFLAFALAALLAARRGHWLLAGLMGALATMTRIPGVLLAVPLLWEAWQQFRSKEGRARLAHSAGSMASLAAMPVSLGLFSMYVRFGLGAPWPWSNLAAGWNLQMAWPWVGVIGNLRVMAHNPITANAVSQFYDALLAVWAVSLLLVGLRRLPITLTLYTAVLLLPALIKILDNNTLMSVSRYLLPLFPLLLVQDQLLPTRGTRIAVAAFSLASQALLLVLFYRWVWVA